MKTVKLLFLAILAVGLQSACTYSAPKEEPIAKVQKAEKVEVFYFHFTRRCATCNAVEKVTKETLAELYGNKVSFSDYNLDEEVGAKKGNELEISGQTLIIMADDTKIDITSEGFLNARSNPEKLKALIQETIDPYL